MAYEVELPPTSKIHPVFHVSQLRKVLRPGTHANATPPSVTDVLVTPVKILAQRWRPGPNGRRAQVQIQWSDPTATDITWEDKEELMQRFPTAPAWGQADSQGGGDVRQHSSVPTGEEEMGLVLHRKRPARLVQPNRRFIGPEWRK